MWHLCHEAPVLPTLLWLGHRPAAEAAIQPLAWECPYAAGVALKRPQNKGRSWVRPQCIQRTQGQSIAYSFEIVN